MSWNLIYENNTVYGLLETEGKTYTRKVLLTFDTMDECFSKIDELKLNAIYPTGDTKVIIFSDGTRTIEDKQIQPPID